MKTKPCDFYQAAWDDGSPRSLGNVFTNFLDGTPSCMAPVYVEYRALAQDWAAIEKREKRKAKFMTPELQAQRDRKNETYHRNATAFKKSHQLGA